MDIKAPVDEKSAGAVNPLVCVQPRMPESMHWGLVIAVFALLAGGGYYAWRTWFGKYHPADSLITAGAQRHDMVDTVTATGTLQLKDYIDVGAQRRLFQVEDQRMQLRLTRLQASIGLFKAFGGGWGLGSR